MERDSRITKNLISIRYWLAFCPLYKRKIFKYEEVRKEFEEIVSTICEETQTEILDIQYKYEYCVILHVSCTSNLSSHDLIGKIKNRTSSPIRKVIKSTKQALWTNNYLVVTNDILMNYVLEEFLSQQKSNPRDSCTLLNKIKEKELETYKGRNENEKH